MSVPVQAFLSPTVVSCGTCPAFVFLFPALFPGVLGTLPSGAPLVNREVWLNDGPLIRHDSRHAAA